MNKTYPPETEIRNRTIRPAIARAGWEAAELRGAYYFTDGRILGDANP